MKDFKLDHDYLVRDMDDPLFRKAARNLTDFLVRQAIAAKYREGIKNRADQRHAGKIQNALTTALRDEKDAISLSSDQIRWIYDLLKDWSAPAVAVNWFIDLFDYVESVIRDLDSDEKSAKSGSTA